MPVLSEKMTLSKLLFLQCNLDSMLDSSSFWLTYLEQHAFNTLFPDKLSLEKIERMYIELQNEMILYQNLLTHWLCHLLTHQEEEKLKIFELSLQAVITLHKKVLTWVNFFKDQQKNGLIKFSSQKSLMPC